MYGPNRKVPLTEKATAFFANEGFYACSLKRVAKELKMTDTAFYKHYKSKEDLGDSIVKEYLQMMDKILEEVESKKTFDEQINTLMFKMIEINMHQVNLLRFCVLRHPEMVRKIVSDPDSYVHPLKRIEKLIIEAQKRGEINGRINSAIIAGQILMSVVVTISVQENGLEIDIKTKDIKSFVSDFILKFLKNNKQI